MDTIAVSKTPVNISGNQKPLNSSEKPVYCQFCGLPLQPYSGKGRPPKYHSDCASLKKSLDYALSRLEIGVFSPMAACHLRVILHQAAEHIVDQKGGAE